MPPRVAEEPILNPKTLTLNPKPYPYMDFGEPVQYAPGVGLEASFVWFFGFRVWSLWSCKVSRAARRLVCH